MQYTLTIIFSTILVATCFSTTAAMYISNQEVRHQAESNVVDADDVERLTTPSSDIVQRLPSYRLPESEGGDQSSKNFPEMDDRGFDEDVFDEGFGEWEPMRRF